MNRLAWPATFVVVVMIVMTAGSRISEAQASREDSNSGSYLYRTFCVSCHGESGRGDGPAANTLPRPTPDLTILAREARGVFPRERVRAVLEGKPLVPAHSRSAMPKWLEVFGRLEHDDATARKRLEALIGHVESLQVK